MPTRAGAASSCDVVVSRWSCEVVCMKGWIGRVVPHPFSISAWRSRRSTKGNASTSTSNLSTLCSSRNLLFKMSCTSLHDRPARFTKSRSVVHQLCFNVYFVQLAPASDSGLSFCHDSIIARHLDSVLLLPEVEHLASCIDRQSVPLLCTLYLKCIPSDTVCQSLLSPER